MLRRVVRARRRARRRRLRGHVHLHSPPVRLQRHGARQPRMPGAPDPAGGQLEPIPQHALLAPAGCRVRRRRLRARSEGGAVSIACTPCPTGGGRRPAGAPKAAGLRAGRAKRAPSAGILRAWRFEEEASIAAFARTARGPRRRSERRGRSCRRRSARRRTKRATSARWRRSRAPAARALGRSPARECALRPGGEPRRLRGGERGRGVRARDVRLYSSPAGNRSTRRTPSSVARSRASRRTKRGTRRSRGPSRGGSSRRSTRLAGKAARGPIARARWSRFVTNVAVEPSSSRSLATRVSLRRAKARALPAGDDARARARSA